MRYSPIVINSICTSLAVALLMISFPILAEQQLSHEAANIQRKKKCPFLDEAIGKCNRLPKDYDDRVPADADTEPQYKREEQTIELVGVTVAGKDIVSFRAREAEFKWDSLSFFGHAFILVGRELSDGTRVYYSAAGFYPDKNQRDIYENKGYKSLYGDVVGPGKVDYKFEDMASSHQLDVYVTPNQARVVRAVLKNWDLNNNYNIMNQNCTHMLLDVARVLGLKIDSSIKSKLLPSTVVSELKEKNNSNSSIEWSENELYRQYGVFQDVMKQHWQLIPTGVTLPHPPPGLPGAASNSQAPANVGIPPSIKPNVGAGVGIGNGTGGTSSPNIGSGGNNGGVCEGACIKICINDKSFCL